MTLALVTGASRGIGRATAHELARRGAALALLGRASPALSRVAAESAARVYPCDLAAVEETVRACETLLATQGVPDVVVHNAGIAHRAPVLELTPELLDAHLAVNLRAPLVVTRAVLPGMLARGSGRLVFVGSISSTLGTAHQAAYNASKWALVGFVKSLAEELRDTGIMAVAVLPGSVDTDMLRGSGFPPRMSAADVAATLAHYGLDAPLAHNGGVIEMFGV